MPLPSHAVKLKRAFEHLEALKSEVSWWINTDPYRIVDEPDPEPPSQFADYPGVRRRFRVDYVSSVPDRFGVLIGDCVFNLRSALDHLALALAQTNTPGLSEKSIATSEFPIYTTKSSYAQNRNKKIGCVASGAITVIDSLQPYHSGNSYMTHPLWQIHELNRIDKHRELTVCGALSTANGQRVVGFIKTRDFNVADCSYFISKGGVYELNAIFAQYSGIPVDPDKEVHLQPEPAIEIAFGGGNVASGESVVPILQGLCDFVRSGVFAALINFLR